MFRLIALKTGKRLTKKEELVFNPSSYSPRQHYNYLKNLSPETNFLLFSCFKLKKKNTVLEYIPEKDLNGLYKLKINNKAKLEVSAIAGKNGSGKSSLLEMIYLSVHNLSVAKSILLDGNKKRVDFAQNYLRCELIFQTSVEEFIQLKMNYDDNSQSCLVFKSNKITQNKYEFEEISIEDFDLKEFFYSIAVNYSIYGLNDYRVGEWINHLFHKNDSYQTPVVINPMRRHGNFDINKEEY